MNNILIVISSIVSAMNTVLFAMTVLEGEAVYDYLILAVLFAILAGIADLQNKLSGKH